MFSEQRHKATHWWSARQWPTFTQDCGASKESRQSSLSAIPVFAAGVESSILASMPPAKNSKSAGMYERIIRAISTPLGFYVLSLLIVEATIGLVLTASKLSAEHVWWGFFVAVGLFLLVFLVVTVLVIWFPKNLLYGKEEHSNPALEPSALRDAIEEIITVKVKPECLKNPPN